ncbi:hypothetical protein [Ideonella sp.]|uniref:hypothetical protein n=1 Tax=Ideonella sp. TaxID=1929293 RepID=UPI003BB53658
MSEDQLTPVPASFLALHFAPGQRVRDADGNLRARYELCEDLACYLVNSAQGLHHDDGLTEDDVLGRCLLGLRQPAAELREGEADWVVTRLAELLSWPPLPASPLD